MFTLCIFLRWIIKQNYPQRKSQGKALSAFVRWRQPSMAGQAEHGGDLVQKVKLEHLKEEIIDLWHYVYALRLRLKDG